MEGGVYLDGEDIRQIRLQDLRQWVSLVAQEPFLFSDSLSANMSFGVPHSAQETVEAMARLVRLDKDQEAFPRGWKTLIGERGVTISGGQRQRVALARAIMTTPHILLLDDAFAHLDEETESEVIGNLLEALPEATLIFTSHRISSLLRADRVVVLNKGELIQAGRPEELRLERGYFQEIIRQQSLLQEVARLGGEEDE
jgi:ATP-binding cassette subfamily B protein